MGVREIIIMQVSFYCDPIGNALVIYFNEFLINDLEDNIRKSLTKFAVNRKS